MEDSIASVWQRGWVQLGLQGSLPAVESSSNAVEAGNEQCSLCGYMHQALQNEHGFIGLVCFNCRSLTGAIKQVMISRVPHNTTMLSNCV